jgi:DNA-directed RNA polymerase specialized sigma24 family protein
MSTDRSPSPPTGHNTVSSTSLLGAPSLRYVEAEPPARKSPGGAPGGDDGPVGPLLTFEVFVADDAPRLRRALRSKYGCELGADLYGDAMEKAWADWARIGRMTNPSGYLWKVAATNARRYDRWTRRPPPPLPSPGHHTAFTASDLSLSLGVLSNSERIAVLMVHGDRASYQEVAEYLNVPVTTVTNLVHRGVKRLRVELRDSA